MMLIHTTTHFNYNNNNNSNKKMVDKRLQWFLKIANLIYILKVTVGLLTATQ